MASAFSDSLMASGGWKHPPWVKFVPDVGTHTEAQNQNKNLT